MSQTERLHKLQAKLAAGQCLSRDAVRAEFEISAATFKRDMVYLRERMHLPVHYNPQRKVWLLNWAGQPADKSAFEVGLALRQDEIHALLVMQQLLTGLEPGGVLGPRMAPLRRRLTQLLAEGLHAPAMDVERRIRVLTLGARRLSLPHFQAVAHALFTRRRLRIVYRSRSSAQTLERELSPQRLVHYRDNWYCDAWCHLRDRLLTFSVDAMAQVQTLDSAAFELAETELDDLLSGSYGIFAGTAKQHARLRFSAERARWVAHENWHPHQRGHHDEAGRWVLDLPVGDMRELVMDILRHVPDVEVLWPDALADEVRRRMRQGLRVMGELDE